MWLVRWLLGTKSRDADTLSETAPGPGLSEQGRQALEMLRLTYASANVLTAESWLKVAWIERAQWGVLIIGGAYLGANFVLGRDSTIVVAIGAIVIATQSAQAMGHLQRAVDQDRNAEDLLRIINQIERLRDDREAAPYFLEATQILEHRLRWAVWWAEYQQKGGAPRLRRRRLLRRLQVATGYLLQVAGFVLVAVCGSVLWTAHGTPSAPEAWRTVAHLGPGAVVLVVAGWLVRLDARTSH